MIKMWLTPKELEKDYGISIHTQKNYRKQNILKYSKIGNKIFYNIDVLNETLTNHNVN